MNGKQRKAKQDRRREHDAKTRTPPDPSMSPLTLETKRVLTRTPERWVKPDPLGRPLLDHAIGEARKLQGARERRRAARDARRASR